MKTFMNEILRGSILSGSTLSQTAYRLVVIEDGEPVPLAGQLNYEYFIPTMTAMVLAIMLLTAAFYILNCCKYKTRIKALDPDGKSYRGWAIWRLRDTSNELELYRAEELVSSMELDFEKDMAVN